MLIFLDTFWFIWMLKSVLFWLFLWQLKDYHIGRFIDHFRTDKGKGLIIDYALIIKLVLLVLFVTSGDLFSYLFSILFLVYLLQSALFVRGVIKKSVRKPKITIKTLLLTAISFAGVIVFLIWTFKTNESLQPALLLSFDIVSPLIISALVIIVQPFFVLVRGYTLRRARIKMQKVKELSKIKVIAITGSYGKTSTKEFLATILSKKYKVLKTNEHQNSEIGVARCILNDLKPSHQIFIAEIGAYNKGKVKEVCSMLKPEIGVVTGVNEQHLALFGSLDNLLSAEGGGELAQDLPKNGLLILNGDNKHCLNLFKKTEGTDSPNKKLYSLSNKVIDSDIWADSVVVNKNSISFIAIDRSGEMMHFDARVLGKQSVQNLLGAILIAKELGMSFGQIADACRGIHQEQGGMTLKNAKHGIYVLDSSYSSNPDGVFADLDYLKVFDGKKVIVMPCLIELGEKSPEIHRKIGRRIAEVCDLAVITSKDKFKDIRKGFDEARDSGNNRRNIAKCLLCDNPQDVYSIVTLFCKSGDAVLLEGRVPAGLTNLLVK